MCVRVSVVPAFTVLNNASYIFTEFASFLFTVIRSTTAHVMLSIIIYDADESDARSCADSDDDDDDDESDDGDDVR